MAERTPCERLKRYFSVARLDSIARWAKSAMVNNGFTCDQWAELGKSDAGVTQTRLLLVEIRRDLDACPSALTADQKRKLLSLRYEKTDPCNIIAQVGQKVATPAAALFTGGLAYLGTQALSALTKRKENTPIVGATYAATGGPPNPNALNTNQRNERSTAASMTTLVLAGVGVVLVAGVVLFSGRGN